MIGNKNILAIIPARGGSKGIPGKNIKLLGGRPLISWTFEEAQKSKYLDRIILSSDNEDIISIARKLKCEVPFKRPAALAQDNTPGIMTVVHAIETIEEKYDYIVLLQPTSPFRSSIDIDNAIKIAHEGSGFCVSICQPDKSPYWSYKVGTKGNLIPLIPNNVSNRQELPKAYMLNGAVYVGISTSISEENTFLNKDTLAYEMPKLRSVDIDDELDFFFAEALINKGLIS